jgi:RNA polymerase sigma factor (sigma-70 family)
MCFAPARLDGGGTIARPEIGVSMSPPGIRNVLHTVTSGTTADADLLARFAATRDESAFELLVWRHAALVQRVCKAVLRDHHAAEDAAQAAFLVLARKAHTFANRGSVVGWLYRVARRIAVRAAKDRARQRVTSAELDRLPDSPSEPSTEPDEVAALCAEVDRLPERYRVPILLCFFERLTHTEAAHRTGWPVGTVAGQLARAKALLARRLSKKGIGVATVVLGVPAGTFIGTTTRAAVAFAVALPSGAVVPGVEPSVIRLAEGALRTVTTFTWKLTAAAAALVCAVSVVTAGMFSFAAPPVPPPEVPVAAAPVPEPKKPAAGDRVANALQRARSKNNLTQIAIAMLNYNDANGHFPENITDKNGKPLLSWRVAIIPYFDGGQELYKQFKLDEPWDSAHNKKLLEAMPNVYWVGFEPRGETKTYYQAFAGPGTVFDPGKKVRPEIITDGPANTLAVVEAGPPVEWTKPADIPYDPKNPLPKLDGPFSNALLAVTADGNPYAFPRNLDETNLRRMIEIADGRSVSPKKLSIQFSLDAEDLKAAQQGIGHNERLITLIADELKEQQKLILELIKRPNASDVDLDRLGQKIAELEFFLARIRKETEELKKQLKADPPADPKK